jgi:hypothetical protein
MPVVKGGASCRETNGFRRSTTPYAAYPAVHAGRLTYAAVVQWCGFFCRKSPGGGRTWKTYLADQCQQNRADVSVWSTKLTSKGGVTRISSTNLAW